LNADVSFVEIGHADVHVHEVADIVVEIAHVVAKKSL